MKKKVRLYISVDASLLEEAKVYATNSNMSLSQLVELGLKQITQTPKRPNLLELLDALPNSPSDFPEDFNFKKAYYEDRKDKYGFGT